MEQSAAPRIIKVALGPAGGQVEAISEGAFRSDGGLEVVGEEGDDD